jgi:DeoR/GlpR family transcriptional regulator of sugar metabolism
LENLFKNIYCDICFFSTKSLSADGLIYDCSREEVLVRASMLKNAAKKVFLCDSEKFNTNAAYKQCDLCEVDYLVSESNLADAFSSVSENLTII